MSLRNFKPESRVDMYVTRLDPDTQRPLGDLHLVVERIDEDGYVILPRMMPTLRTIQRGKYDYIEYELDAKDRKVAQLLYPHETPEVAARKYWERSPGGVTFDGKSGTVYPISMANLAMLHARLQDIEQGKIELRPVEDKPEQGTIPLMYEDGS